MMSGFRYVVLLWLAALDTTSMAVAADVGFCYESLLKALPDDISICERFAASNEGTQRQRAIAFVNLGHDLRATKYSPGLPADTLAYWDKAIATDPTFAEPWISKGEVLAEFGEDNDASAAFDKALTLDPKAWRALAGRAKIALKKGDTASALTSAKAAVEAAPDVGNAHQDYAEVLRRAGRLAEAEAEFRAAAVGYKPERRRPGIIQDADPRDALGSLLFEEGKFASAADQWSGIIAASEPNGVEPQILAARAGAYEKLNRNRDAASDYERAADLITVKELAEPWRAKAAMLMAKSGDTSSARQKFADLLRSGKLRSILRVQVFLRNNGFDEVAIDGQSSPALEKAVERCLQSKACIEAPGLPI